MNEVELIVVLTALASFFGLVGYLINKVTGLIRIKMERKYNLVSSEQIKELQQLKDLKAWKARVEKRLQHLEAIATEDPESNRRLLDANQDEEVIASERVVPNQLRNRS